jgi:hypothetical protein
MMRLESATMQATEQMDVSSMVHDEETDYYENLTAEELDQLISESEPVTLRRGRPISVVLHWQHGHLVPLTPPDRRMPFHMHGVLDTGDLGPFLWTKRYKASEYYPAKD